MKIELVRTALLLGLQFGLCTQARSEWFTVIGDHSDPAEDTVEVDPSLEPAAQGQRIARVRVSRSKPSNTPAGVAYRSYEAVVIFNCPKGTAQYSRVVFYDQPLWNGRPHLTAVYSPADAPTMEFGNITPSPGLRIMRAACQSRAITTG